MKQNKADTLVGKSFSPGDHWYMIRCDSDYLYEFIIEFFCAPTFPVDQNPQKSNFTQKFDILVFIGKVMSSQCWRNSKVERDAEDIIFFKKINKYSILTYQLH